MVMNKQIIWGVIAISLILSLAVFVPKTVQAKDEPGLEFKFEKGQKHRYKVEYDAKVSGEVPMLDRTGGTMTLKRIKSIGGFNQTFVLDREVIKVDDQGIAAIQITFISIKANINDPLDNPDKGEASFNSEKKSTGVDKDPMFEILAAMLEEEFTIKIDKTGKIIEAKGMEKVKEALDDPKDFELLDSMNNAWFKKTMQMSITQFPTPPAKATKGSSWKGVFELDMPKAGTLTIETKETYKTNKKVKKRECAKINIKLTKMDLPLIDKNSPMLKDIDSFDMKLISFKGTGVRYFDRDEGIDLKNNMKIDAKWKFTIQATFMGMTGLQSGSADLHMTSQIELVEEKMKKKLSK